MSLNGFWTICFDGFKLLMCICTPISNHFTQVCHKVPYLCVRLKNTNTLQYADHTVIYTGQKDVKKLSKLLNEDLEAILILFFEKELLANLKNGKTESMLFGTGQRLSRINEGLELFYREQNIRSTDKYKYLGNIVDPSLTLNDNFEAKYKTALKCLKLLSRAPNPLLLRYTTC